MIPATQRKSGQGANYIGEDVVRVEDAPVGKQALNDLGPDPQEEGYGNEGDVQGTATRAIDDPVEA